MGKPWKITNWSFMGCCNVQSYFFSCNQAALRTHLSVRPSVCPAVVPFSQCFCDRIIMKFSGVITNDRSAKGQGQGSKVKVTEVKTQFSRFRTVTPVWIHLWWWMMHKAWCLGEVHYCFSRSYVKFQGRTAKKWSILTDILRFRTVTPVWISGWLWNDAQSLV